MKSVGRDGADSWPGFLASQRRTSPPVTDALLIVNVGPVEEDQAAYTQEGYKAQAGL